MHTPRCKHALGPMEGYVEQALALGLEEVGFSDHNPLPNGLGANVRMADAELDDYVADVLRLRERYRGAIEVRLGLEMDYIAGLEPYLAAQRARHPWDYVIGSVHYLDPQCRTGAWSLMSTGGDAHALFARYYGRVREMVATGFYDIVGHLDVAKRAGVAATVQEAETERVTLEAIARAGMAVEINTSGARHPELAESEFYPRAGLLREALALGIPLVVNSDAHAPRDVGKAFESAEVLLRGLGCQSLARYAGGVRTLHGVYCC